MSRALGSAAVATGALFAGSLALRLASPSGADAPTPSNLVPQLWALGGLVTLALTHAWAPAVAWSAVIVSATTSALGVSGLAREVRLASGNAAAPVLDALLVTALVVPLAVAAAYATAGGPRPRWLAGAAWGSVIALAAVFLAGYLGRTLAGGGEGLGPPQGAWLAAIAAIGGLGAIRDVRPAVIRTRARLASMDHGTPLSALRILLDELVPGREAGRAEAAESERGRIAADLHAEVLPALRRAMVAAEGGGTAERLAVDLRAAVDEVESLLTARRSIVLEEIGLLAAVEWLAERIEERSDVRVQIDVADPRRGGVPGGVPGGVADGADPAGTDPAGGAPIGNRPPREVERAAFRVAQLALDNVVEHAPASAVRVSLAVGPDAVALVIDDDGPGLAMDESDAARRGRRGIADMRTEARACGAEIALRRGTDGVGTSVAFSWRA